MVVSVVHLWQLAEHVEKSPIKRTYHCLLEYEKIYLHNE
jgi:hypothetical protein